MRKSIGLYGTVIVAVILGLGLLLYFFAAGGFMGSIRSTKPKSELGSKDQKELIADVTKRAKPILEVTPKKLNVGETYDLLGADFSVRAQNADGESLPVEVLKVMDPDGKEIHTDVGFTPEKEGVYTVCYRAGETYRTFTLETIREYRFAAD